MISSRVSPSERARRQLRGLFPEDPEFHAVTAWAKDILRGASLDPARSPLRSLRAVRRADRRLSRGSARYLVDLASGRSPGNEDPPASPHLH